MPFRYSKQRELIYENLMNRNDHPTASQVYEDLKVNHPELSLGTVYRNLNFLVNEKRIRCIDLGNTTDHYDALTIPHHHFVCQRCKKIYNVFLDNKDDIANLKTSTNHLIKQINIVMSGICENCLKEMNFKEEN